MRLSGILPPLPTPFDADGNLDLGLLRALVEHLNGTGLSGYLALGSNGEAVHLTPAEAPAVVRAVREAAAPGMTVLAGTGQLSTAATLDATARAAAAGADAVLVFPPFYYRGLMTGDALRRHFETVASASPVPVVLYNVPVNTGLTLPVEVAAALSRHQNVLGIKDSAGDVGQLAELVRTTRGGRPFDVLAGSFAATLPGLAIGASGAILAVANVAPRECVAILDLVRQGRPEEAREVHMRILPVARLVTSRFGVPGLKAALALLGHPAGLPRLPLLPLQEEHRPEVGSTLREAGLLPA